MRLRKTRGDTAADTSIGALATARSCPRCGAENAAQDSFCSECGASLNAPAAQTLVSLPMAPVGSHQELPATPRSRRRWPIVLVCAVAALSLAAAVAFAALWRVEANHATRLQRELRDTQTALTDTRSRLDVTTAQLDATTALAERRRTVLVQAQKVLAGVDRLLSSVDGIKGAAGDLQTEGDNLAYDADNLTSSLGQAADYAVHTDVYSFDIDYYNSLIGDANDYYYAFVDDETAFADAETSYGKASTSFGNHADAFSTAVRQLQRQLKAVTSK
jgi:hypothetical protein